MHIDQTGSSNNQQALNSDSIVPVAVSDPTCVFSGKCLIRTPPNTSSGNKRTIERFSSPLDLEDSNGDFQYYNVIKSATDSVDPSLKMQATESFNYSRQTFISVLI